MASPGGLVGGELAALQVDLNGVSLLDLPSIIRMKEAFQRSFAAYRADGVVSDYVRQFLACGGLRWLQQQLPNLFFTSSDVPLNELKKPLPVVHGLVDLYAFVVRAIAQIDIEECTRDPKIVRWIILPFSLLLRPLLEKSDTYVSLFGIPSRHVDEVEDELGETTKRLEACKALLAAAVYIAGKSSACYGLVMQAVRSIHKDYCVTKPFGFLTAALALGNNVIVPEPMPEEAAAFDTMERAKMNMKAQTFLFLEQALGNAPETEVDDMLKDLLQGEIKLAFQIFSEDLQYAGRHLHPDALAQILGRLATFSTLLASKDPEEEIKELVRLLKDENAALSRHVAELKNVTTSAAPITGASVPTTAAGSIAPTATLARPPRPVGTSAIDGSSLPVGPRPPRPGPAPALPTGPAPRPAPGSGMPLGHQPVTAVMEQGPGGPRPARPGSAFPPSSGPRPPAPGAGAMPGAPRPARPAPGPGLAAGAPRPPRPSTDAVPSANAAPSTVEAKKEEEPSKPNPKPAQPMKGLYWAPLSQPQVQQSIFHGIDESSIFVALSDPASDLNRFFTAKPGVATAAAVSSESPPARTTLAIITPKERQSKEIALRKIRQTLKGVSSYDLAGIVRQCNIAGLFAERDAAGGLAGTLVAPPNPYEIIHHISSVMQVDDATAQAIDQAEEADLEEVERFIKIMSTVPKCRDRLKAIAFMLKYAAASEDAERRLNLIRSAATAVRDSAALKSLVSALLASGNYLNGGTKRGGAFGFRLDTKAVELKGNDNKITLMDIIGRYALTNPASPLGRLGDELNCLLSGSEQDLYIKVVGDSVGVIDSEHKSAASLCKQLTEAGDPFAPNSEAMMTTATQRVNALKELLGSVEKDVASLQKYIPVAESEEDKNADAAWKIFGLLQKLTREFLSSLDKARRLGIGASRSAEVARDTAAVPAVVDAEPFGDRLPEGRLALVRSSSRGTEPSLL